MPQLDKVSFFSQLIWFFLVFFTLYFLVVKRWLPVVVLSTQIRRILRKVKVGPSERHMRVIPRIYTFTRLNRLWPRKLYRKPWWLFRGPTQKFTIGFYTDKDLVVWETRFGQWNHKMGMLHKEVFGDLASILEASSINNIVFSYLEPESALYYRMEQGEFWAHFNDVLQESVKEPQFRAKVMSKVVSDWAKVSKEFDKEALDLAHEVEPRIDPNPFKTWKKHTDPELTALLGSRTLLQLGLFDDQRRHVSGDYRPRVDRPSWVQRQITKYFNRLIQQKGLAFINRFRKF